MATNSSSSAYYYYYLKKKPIKQTAVQESPMDESNTGN